MPTEQAEHELTIWLRSNHLASDFDGKSFFLQQENKGAKLRENDPDLAWLFSREDTSLRYIKPLEVLQRNGFPTPTLEFRRQIRKGSQDKVDKSLVKDGNIYLLRGDYPGLATKGIYAYGYMRWNMTTDQFLLADQDIEPSAHLNFHPQTMLEQYMWQHSNGGYEFVSGTPNDDIARIHPKYEKNAGSVYVIRVPLERVILNYASVVTNSWMEAEYLITDFVLPDQILAEIDPKKVNHVDPRDYIN